LTVKIKFENTNRQKVLHVLTAISYGGKINKISVKHLLIAVQAQTKQWNDFTTVLHVCSAWLCNRPVSRCLSWKRHFGNRIDTMYH